MIEMGQLSSPEIRNIRNMTIEKTNINNVKDD